MFPPQTRTSQNKPQRVLNPDPWHSDSTSQNRDLPRPQLELPPPRQHAPITRDSLQKQTPKVYQSELELHRGALRHRRASKLRAHAPCQTH